MRRVGIAGVVCGVLAGCGSVVIEEGSGGGPAGGATSANGTSATGTGGSAPSTGCPLTLFGDRPGDDATNVFRFDPETGAVEDVGKIHCVPNDAMGLSALAVDPDGSYRLVGYKKGDVGPGPPFVVHVSADLATCSIADSLDGQVWQLVWSDDRLVGSYGPSLFEILRFDPDTYASLGVLAEIEQASLLASDGGARVAVVSEKGSASPSAVDLLDLSTGERTPLLDPSVTSRRYRAAASLADWIYLVPQVSTEVVTASLDRVHAPDGEVESIPGPGVRIGLMAGRRCD